MWDGRQKAVFERCPGEDRCENLCAWAAAHLLQQGTVGGNLASGGGQTRGWQGVSALLLTAGIQG